MNEMFVVRHIRHKDLYLTLSPMGYQPYLTQNIKAAILPGSKRKEYAQKIETPDLFMQTALHTSGEWRGEPCRVDYRLTMPFSDFEIVDLEVAEENSNEA